MSLPADQWVDDFTAGVDMARWPNSHGHTVENGRVHLPATTAYPALWMTTPLDLVGGHVYAELVTDDWTTPGIEYRMDVRDDLPAGGTVRFLINGGNLACGSADSGGVFTYPQSQPYDPVAHRWLRIGATSTTAVEWSASPDGTTWTTLHTMDPAPVDPTAVVVLFVAGEWTGTTSGGLWVDNVNTLGLPPPSTLLNDAAGVYVGDTAAVAVYAGSVKVWPPAPAVTAAWGRHYEDEEVPVALIFSGLTTATAGVVTVPIPAYDGDPALDGGDLFAPLNRGSDSPNPPRLLLDGGGEIVFAGIAPTLGDVYFDWAGHSVALTLDGAGHVTAAEVTP